MNKISKKTASLTSLFKANFNSAPQAYKLPDLPYGYAELEPVISGKIMELHHKKHHQGYVTNFNAAVEQALDAQAKGDFAKVTSLQGAIRFNGGGHINHSIFWQNLAPIAKGGGERPGEKSDLTKAIVSTFGSYDNFIAEFNRRTLAVQGSGWGWLGYDKATKQIRIQEMPNQDPVTLLGFVPLLGIDVWEHAYYLQYVNMRADYLKEIWKVVNWKDVEKRFLEASK